MKHRAPIFETKRYAFYTLHVGSTLVRKLDNASVYFQPGDDTAQAIENVEHCANVPEMYQGENAKVFDRWAREYL